MVLVLNNPCILSWYIPSGSLHAVSVLGANTVSASIKFAKDDFEWPPLCIPVGSRMHFSPIGRFAGSVLPYSEEASAYCARAAAVAVPCIRKFIPASPGAARYSTPDTLRGGFMKIQCHTETLLLR